MTPDNQALIGQNGGPTGPLSVSDYADANIQATPGVAFDMQKASDWPLRLVTFAWADDSGNGRGCEAGSLLRIWLIDSSVGLVRSNDNALHLIERNLIIPPIIEASRPG